MAKKQWNVHCSSSLLLISERALSHVHSLNRWFFVDPRHLTAASLFPSVSNFYFIFMFPLRYFNCLLPTCCLFLALSSLSAKAITSGLRKSENLHPNRGGLTSYQPWKQRSMAIFTMATWHQWIAELRVRSLTHNATLPNTITSLSIV